MDSSENLSVITQITVFALKSVVLNASFIYNASFLIIMGVTVSYLFL